MTVAVRSYHQLARSVERRSPTSGTRYARKELRVEKGFARQAVLAAFGNRAWPTGLSIVTLPGLDWSFERQLIHNREHGSTLTFRRLCHQTFICALEREDAIYRAALKRMPGADSGLVVLPPEPYARETMRTLPITRYHLCSFEDFAAGNAHTYDGAWLDFNGQLTEARLAALAAFWGNVRWRLMVTLLAARTPRPLGAAIKEAGGYGHFLEGQLAGSRLVSVLHYRDTSPMVQICLDKEVSR